MFALPVVKHFDVVKYFVTCFVKGFELLVVRELVFQTAEEAFYHRVIIRHAFAAHAGEHAIVFQLLLIGFTGVLHALIAVMNHPGLGLA